MHSIYIAYAFTTEGFLEVAIESWPEWDLNPRPKNSFRCSNQLSYQAMNSTCTKNQLCTATLISSFAQCSLFISAIAIASRHICFKRNLAQVITLVAE